MFDHLFQTIRKKVALRLATNQAKKKSRKHALHLERLDARLVLAGVPGTATLTNGQLVVCGDDTDNTIIVSNAADGRIFVSADFLDADEFFAAADVTSIRITGGDGADTIVATSLSTRATIEGDAGNDTLFGTAFDDTLLGGAGNDTIIAAGGNDTVNAGAGTDDVRGGNGDDILNGDEDNDTLFGGAGNDTLNGNDGDDTLLGGTGSDTANGGAGNDVLVGGESGVDTLNGNDGDDLLFGLSESDIISGGAGADTIYGNEGGDELRGGDGADRIFGGDGVDVLEGNDGADLLTGDDGADAIMGGADGDTVYGGAGADAIAGQAGNDALVGGVNRDVLIGGAGGDVLKGFGSDDVLVGGSTNVDNDSSALAGIAATWASGDDYDARISSIQAQLASGANDDGANDTLEGAEGRDWFLSGSSGDELDQSSDEIALGRDLVVSDDSYATADGETLTVDAAAGLLANDIIPNPSTTTVDTTPVSAPTGGTLVLSDDGSFTYTPNSGTTSDSFTYRVTDTETNSSFTATVAIDVQSQNTAPTAAAASFEVTAGTTFTAVAGTNDLLQGSSDADNDTLMAELVTLPTNGTATINADGTFTYTPNAGFFGFDEFTFRVTDGMDPSDAVVAELVVTGENQLAVKQNVSDRTVVGNVTLPSGIGNNAVFEFEHAADTPELLQVNIDDHVEGVADAPLTLIEYFDFQCPVCAAFHPIVDQMLQDFPNDLQVVRRHLPLTSIHPNAVAAARAGEAAANQGQFEAMGDLLFTRQTDWANLSESEATSLFETYATELGLNLTQFQTDVADQATLDRINRDADEAASVPFNSTPTFVLNGEPFNPSPNTTAFRTSLQQALDDLTSPFVINRETGEITVRDADLLDFDSTSSYSLDVYVDDGTNNQTIKVDIAVGDTAPPALPANAQLIATGTGLEVYDFEVGTGVSPTDGDSVVVEYVGYLPDGTIFDSNSRATFSLTGVIDGFEEGLRGMNVGGRRRMVIPPDLGYGAGGNAGAGISGTDTIVFDVTLLDIA